MPPLPMAELALPAYAPYQQRHAWRYLYAMVRTELLTIDRDRFMAELRS